MALSLVGILAVGSMSAFAQGNGQGRGMGQGGQGNGQGQYSSDISATDFTDEEKTRLIYGQQEERLAGDVYKKMFDKYGLETFDKISQSEERHTDSMGRLLQQAGLPETTGYGELQSTYDALIAKGNLSLKDAIEVGITIEILDIEDIDKTLAETSNESIIRTYEKLREGSINHLNSYVAQLQKNNFTTDLDWGKFTSQEEVSEKLECLNLSPEEREAKESEKHGKKGEKGERGEHGEKGEHRGKGDGRGEGRHMEENMSFEKPENFEEMNREERQEYARSQGMNPEEMREQRESKAGENEDHAETRRGGQESRGQKGKMKRDEDRDFDDYSADEKKQKAEKFLKKAKKGDKYKEFSGKKQERKQFQDEDTFEDDESSEAVHFLQTRGIIKGYEDGNFQPKKGISRAESLKILIESTGTSTSEVSRTSFSDVDASEWYAPYIETAKKEGLVKGYKDGSFKPHQTVNQAELLKIAFNAFGIDLANYETNLTQWYGPYLQYAFDNNLLDKDEVSPEATMTRETFSKVIYRLIQQQEAL